MATPTIASVTPISFLNGQTGVVIHGTNYAGAGNTVELSDNPTHGAGTLVAQTITAESTTDITITVVQGALASGTLYVFVTNTDPATSAGFAVVLADALKTVAETGQVAEANMSVHHLLKKPATTPTSDVADATRWPAGAAVFRVPAAVTGGGKIIVVYQAGTLGATGLVFQQSDDAGDSWSAQTQVSSRQDVYPAAVMNPASGDVHIVYAKTGTPSLSSVWSVWGRALAFNGTTWTVGGEVTLATGGATVGFSNVTAAVDSAGRIAWLGARHPSTGNDTVGGAATTAPWDLSSMAAVAVKYTGATTSTQRPFLRFAVTGGAYELMALIEEAGTFRIFHAPAVTAGTGAITYTQQTTFLDESIGEFDAQYNAVGTGALFIVNKSGNTVRWRTWTPSTATLSSSSVLAGDASFPARSPAVSLDATTYIVAYLQEVATNQRALRVVRMTEPTVVYDLAVDDAADGWLWTKLPADVSATELIIALWCESLNTPFDVNIGVVATDIFKSSTDIFAGADTVVAGPVASDTGSVADVPIAGEAIGPATDTGHGAETMQNGPQVLDTGAVLETNVQLVAYANPETGTITETMVVGPAEADTGAADDSDVKAAEIKAAAETGAGSEGMDVAHALADTAAAAEAGRTVEPALPDTGHGTDVAARLIDIADAGSIVESFDSYGIGFVVSVDDTGRVIETFGGSGGGTGRQRYDVLALLSNGRAGMHPGPDSTLGWERRGLENYLDTWPRLFSFGDIDEDFNNIVFATHPGGDAQAWDKLLRSEDGGYTWNPVGPSHGVSCVAYSPDGSLWCTGNDGSTFPASTDLGCPNDNNFFGRLVSMRQIFRSLDKGLTWGRVYDDQGHGFGCRYSHLTQIAVDPNDASRVMAIGLNRGAVVGNEMQVVRSSDTGATWTRFGSTDLQSHDLDHGGYQTNVTVLGVGGGRFVYFGQRGDLSAGVHEIRTTDDFGSTWDTRYTFDHTSGNAVHWRGATYRDGRIYAVKEGDGWNSVTGEMFLVSLDDGATWTPFTSTPTATGGAKAIAYDYRLKTLWTGGSFGLYLMDDPTTGGSWVSKVDDAVAVVGSSTVTERGLAVLNTISALVEIVLTDAVVIVEELPVGVLAAATAQGVEQVGFIFQLFDTAQAQELAAILKRRALTVRLFMHSGRVRLRMEGTTGPVFNGNPSA